jgi:hypothetical protein
MVKLGSETICDRLAKERSWLPRSRVLGALGAYKSDPGQVEMIYHKLLLSITVIAFFLAQAEGESGDPLNPSQLGESMSMPLPQELLQEAKMTGVITKSNPLYESDSKQLGFSVVPSHEADADNSLDNVNVTGAWSFDLIGKAPEKMKLYLIQNKDVIAGQGVINRGNETEKATANGSISGEQMSLNVTPEGVSNLYKLNLSLSSLAAGTYTAYMADGSSRSGEVTFAVSANIFKTETVAKDDPGADADPAASTPAWLSGTEAKQEH